jgi:hypothetical protein
MTASALLYAPFAVAAPFALAIVIPGFARAPRAIDDAQEILDAIAVGGTAVIDDVSHPGAWATHIAHTPHLAAQVDGESFAQDTNVND